MASVHSPRSFDRSQAALERASISRWARQKAALDALETAAQRATPEQASALRDAGYGFLLPDYNAPRLANAS